MSRRAMKQAHFPYFFIALVIAYLTFTFMTPIDPATVARYHISEFQVRLIGMSVTIPVVLIWLVALYGYHRFRSYANKIAHDKEGDAFNLIANGLMILVLSLPLTSLISSIVRRLAVLNPELLGSTTIIRNYLPVLFHVAAFWVLLKGASALTATLRPKVSIRYSLPMMFGLIAFSSLFTWLLVARPFGGTVESTYFMPAWLVVMTIAVPLLFAWYCGACAVYHLYLYRKKVKGVVYKQMFKNLVAGLGTIVIFSIITQIVVSLTEKLTRLNFTPLLILVYILIILLAVGYGLLARGARQLKKIEEV